MKKSRSHILLFIIFAAALTIRLINIDQENFWTDEAESIYFDSRGTIFEVARNSLQNAYLPFYDVLLSIWMRAFGVSEFSARSLSAIIGGFSVILIFFVGKSLFNEETGLISGFIMAMSSFHVYYSQEARPYGLLFLLFLLSFYFSVSYAKSGKKVNLALYALSAFLMLMTHAFGIVAFAAENLYFLSRKRNAGKKFWITVQLLIAASIAPFYYVWYASGARYFYDSWIPSPGFWDILKTFYLFSAGETRSGVSLALGGMISLIFGLLLIHLIWGLFRERTKPAKENSGMENITMLLILLLFPIISLYIISIISNPIYLTRYIIYGSAPFYILISRSIAGLSGAKKAAVLSAILLSSSLILLQDFRIANRENWPEAASYLKQNAEPSSYVLVNTPTSIYALSYYYDKECFDSPDIRQCLAFKHVYGVRNSGELAKSADDGRDIFLVLFNSEYVDKNGTLLDHFGKNYFLKDKEEFDHLSIYHYSR